MSPKEEAKELLNEHGSDKDSLNFILHLCDEIIYDFEHKFKDKEKVQHWKQVILEVENSKIEK